MGLRDRKLSERVQLKADLTLDKAITVACQSESVRKQQSVIRGDKSEIAIESSINVVNRHKANQSGVKGSMGKQPMQKNQGESLRTSFVLGVVSHLFVI